jgi:hypothetical protein
MGQHALLAPSSSHRWLACTPSARLEAEVRNTESSRFADEGTSAHALGEYKLRKFLGQKVRRPQSQFDSDELERYTDAYFDFACELIAEALARSEDALVLVEQRLDCSEFAPEAFGTADLVIISEGQLDLIDLKYGRGVRVSSIDNSQLKIYALAILGLYGKRYNIERVRMTIYQPRIDNITTSELTVDELNEWSETELKPKAQLAYKGEGELVAGEHCRWCKVGALCRARAERNLDLLKMEFARAELLTDVEITDVLAKAKELESWVKEIWQYAYDEAKAGRKKWAGFKLVEAKGRRRYTDAAEVAKAVLETGEFTEDQIYTQNIIGISAMEKLLGKKRCAELLGSLIEKPEVDPQLVPESSPKREWYPESTIFETIE